jgi:hypothetical protein
LLIGRLRSAVREVDGTKIADEMDWLLRRGGDGFVTGSAGLQIRAVENGKLDDNVVGAVRMLVQLLDAAREAGLWTELACWRNVSRRLFLNQSTLS